MTRLTLEEPVTVGEFAIVAIARSCAHADWVGGTLVGAAAKEPVAIVIRSADAIWMVRLEDPGRRPAPAPSPASRYTDDAT